ncbi:MAG: lipocalin family protein [Saprospiraceae bacterium]
MKKTIMLVALTLVLGACGTSKTVSLSKKDIKGNWTLNTITYSEAGTYNVTLLEDVSKECFEGSTWQFVSNNNTGNYNINNTNCLVGARHFVFTVQKIDKETGLYDFLLKPTNEKHKSDTQKGFRLKLSALSDNMMQWQQTLSVEGKPFTISMNFNK